MMPSFLNPRVLLGCVMLELESLMSMMPF
ncbi:hypothetical protein OIU84_030181 [Salix udensis]|uniref:Uncharacterized protein n=1 Tax=Salix udensis TaxID=889485 RepID=A0AAD6KAY9_9ROSI|nr:hypothetical protein OIU84_030181 [Salix udensis]